MIDGEIFIGGGPPFPRYRKPAGETIRIAADSGYELAARLVGLADDARVDVLVGDLDSISPAALADARSRSIEVVTFPSDKDLTDFELAVDVARARGVRRLTVYGGISGRLDHLVAIVDAVRCLADEFDSVRFEVGDHSVVGARARSENTIEAGRMFSLLAGPNEAVVSIQGAKWCLDRSKIRFGSGRTLSNVAIDTTTVQCHEGSVLIIEPAPILEMETMI